MAAAGGEPYDKGKDDERKRRPEVEHYKPGAFTGRRTGSEDGRRPRSADCSTRGNEGGGGQDRGAAGGGGGGKADTLSGGRGRGRFEDQRKSGSANGRKKPEMEPYVPKRVQEQQKVEEIGKSKEDTNSLTETSRSKKKKNKKKEITMTEIRHYFGLKDYPISAPDVKVWEDIARFKKYYLPLIFAVNPCAPGPLGLVPN